MHISRLFEIVYLLLDKKILTAKQLAEHFEVSTRTILRDIETLSASGIPIYTTQGKGGGIKLVENFVLNKSVLTSKEQDGILSALQGLNAVEVPDTDKVISKLATLFNKNATDWIDIDFSPWGSDAKEKAKFILLRDAILDKKVVEFDYYDYYDEKTKRSCEPLKIVFKEKSWYLSAFCRLKNDYRTFKLSRIKNLYVKEKVFEEKVPRVSIKPIMAENFCTVTLEIQKEMRFRVRDEFPEKDIQLTDEGNYIVKTLIPIGDWGYSCILSYGEYAKVLAPEDIKQAIKDKLYKATKNYL